MEITSNHIKALLFLEDITEGIPISQDDCFTIQHFNYNCSRQRDSTKMPNGPTGTTVLRFVIKSLPEEGGKTFYQRLTESTAYPFSFVFNATFDANKRLCDYEDAMVISGYIINIEEAFGNYTSDPDKTDRMLMSVDVLLRSITYIGKKSNKTLCITN